MGKRSYQQYLQSDHWKRLRSRKRRKSKNGACAICGAVGALDTHHLLYRNLYDVKTQDLRLLCRGCHFLGHDLMRSGELQITATTHNAMFMQLKTAVDRYRCVEAHGPCEVGLGRAASRNAYVRQHGPLSLECNVIKRCHTKNCINVGHLKAVDAFVNEADATPEQRDHFAKMRTERGLPEHRS